MKGLALSPTIAVDTETQGLKVPLHRLCLVQLCGGDDECHLVQLSKDDYDKAPNLKQLLADPKKTKLFHYARFDVWAIEHWLGVVTTPIFCTKIASKLVRTYGARHNLASLVSELLGLELNKQQQSSDWAAPMLSEEQQAYAASDVIYLHRLQARLTQMLVREGKLALAEACFDFLPHRVQLDQAGFEEEDIFAH